ncbi:serine protein kinase [soil metagenome]
MSKSVDVDSVAEDVERRFHAGRRVLSFTEYLALFEEDPIRFSRDASRFLRDALSHFGTKTVEYPWGNFTRWNMFDLPWEVANPGQGVRGALIGQEQVQAELVRALANFAREGRPSRMVLLHGPNGSAKSTIASCLIRGLEHYSKLDEGALYRFHWVFPTMKTVRGSLGFGKGEAGRPDASASYAHLAEDQIDAKIVLEVRDHPLFLVPLDERRKLLERAWAGAKKEGVADPDPPCDWILRGELSHKAALVYDALLSSYRGSWREVLKHVQVERYFVSQRYRVGAVTVGPQMSVDAGERQLTMDRSLSALPPSLQAITFYEAKGELIDAAGGVLEFSDLLKRPLDTFKYLQLSIETGEVALTQQNVQLNCVMIASANEVHLDAFREHPEFASFRGRIELVRTPYLRSYLQEQAIYDDHVAPQVRRHVAPHATEAAAMFAILTRMRKCTPDRYPRVLGAALSSLTAIEKMDLYAKGAVPERFEQDARKLLRANIKDVYDESDAYPIYEGRIGASPREMRVVLLDAAQSTSYVCLSPLAVLEETEALCQRRAEFEWLQQEPLGGGYHDPRHFLESLLERLLDTWEEEMHGASGIGDEDRYAELFDRYVQHVSVWVKKERVRNKLTGEYEEPDENLMREVAKLLDVKGDPTESRGTMIGNVAAWAIDHPGLRIDAVNVFPVLLKKMRDAIRADRRPAVAARVRDLVILVREDGSGLDAARRKDATAMLERLETKFGYCRFCATDAASTTLRKRFSDLVV